MRNLSLIVAAAASFGALALSGCSSCTQQQEAAQQAIPSTTCGPGTVAQGAQCVGTTPVTTATTPVR